MLLKENRTKPSPPSNEEIARALEEVADLLEEQGANTFRVRAYRNGAQTLRSLDRPVADILAESGITGLEKLPAIGRSLARSIERLVRTGRLPLLERLRGESEAERRFMTLPGIGREMASRIHEYLGIETLPELQAAASDGRLGEVPGFGEKRVRAILECLRGRFQRPETDLRKPIQERKRDEDEPPVDEILSVDREYREKAAAGKLRLIAPHRFNPTGQAWLPILHTQRGDRHYTALYSNTARAHELGTTRDWVVVYRDDHGGDGRWTVITSQFGPLRGKRIVRGREKECREYYRRLQQQSPRLAGQSTSEPERSDQGASSSIQG